MKREKHNLSGIWDFIFLGNVDADTIDISKLEFNDRIPVPGCFDASPKYAGKRGIAIYATELNIESGNSYQLVFNAVQHWCRIYLDGVQLAEHANGFTQFTVNVPPAENCRKRLVIVTDNSLNTEYAPLHLSFYDWYQYGGIPRSVELHKLPESYIISLEIETVNYQTREIAVTVKAASGHSKQEKLKLECAGNSIEQDVELSGEKPTFIMQMKLKDAELWSLETPNLHDLKVSFGDDVVTERIGIRQISTAGRKLLINDQPVILKGFNRHEIHPELGFAIPENIMIEDLQLLKEMGCNFIRGSHYPQDKKFLALCDEMGMLVWNESIAWGNKEEQLTDSSFIDAAMTNLDEMVEMSRNHPSVIMWGVLNEGASNNATCRPAYEKLLSRLRELDSSRPVTFASMHWPDDICFDLADIISINYYPGWYWDEIDQIPYNLNEIVKRVNSTGNEDKPLIMSEIGAGALYGWRDRHEVRWSEQYQARLLEKVISYMFTDSPADTFAGLSIWQFCDVRTSEDTATAMGRPRGFNNKGVVDEFRRPKMAFDTVKKLFNK